MKTDNPSPTHDSEDWLDEILLSFANRIENLQRGKTYNWDDEKQQVLAHYAHYLKPEDVDDIVADASLHSRLHEATMYDRILMDDKRTPEEIYTAITRWSGEEIRDIKAQLSKLNREEEKDAKT